MSGRTTISGCLAAASVMAAVSFAPTATAAGSQQQCLAAAPDESEVLPCGSTAGSHVAGVPTSGHETASAYLYRRAGWHRTAANDPLTMAFDEKSVGKKGADYADSLSGGPDYWEVTGIAVGGLSLREKPSPQARRVKQFPNGTVLKNLGCKNRRGRRWCNVERPDDPSIRGWVNGRYLRESAGPK